MIRTEALTKVYDMGDVKVHALRGVDLEIEKGEFVAVMGPSGSGKSTLLHMLGGLDKPTSGKVYIDGAEISDMREDELTRLRAEKIGFVFQFHNLVPTLTAMENVELPMVFKGTRAEKRVERAKELLRMVGLGDRLDHKPSQLSGGQQQRVAVARALANNPSIILGDEPTGELDSRSGAEVLELLKRMNKEEDLTLVVVTHDSEVANHADRILQVRDGMLQNEGKVR
jgi:putative ABC transport system ATP-binding protein